MNSLNRYHLEQQGYHGLDDRAMDELSPWLGLAPAVCSGVGLAATLAGSGTTMLLLAPVGVVAAATGRHPVEWIVDRTVRRGRSRVRPIPIAGAPRRFAYAFAVAWLVGAGLAFVGGQTVVASALGMAFTVATGLAAATDICLGCVLWHQVQRLPGVRRREAATPWPRVRLREDEL